MSFETTLAKGLSLAGSLAQLWIVAGLGLFGPDCRSAPCSGASPDLRVFEPWAPHIENLGEGRPAFRGRRCPGPQEAGTTFRIVDAPLPTGYDPHAFPDSDVVACVRLDPYGVVMDARLLEGTGRAGVDRRLIRSLYRQWRFESVYGITPAPGWQRVRLSSAYQPWALSSPEPRTLL